MRSKGRERQDRGEGDRRGGVRREEGGEEWRRIEGNSMALFVTFRRLRRPYIFACSIEIRNHYGLRSSKHRLKIC
jgi:hypothetical protein